MLKKRFMVTLQVDPRVLRELQVELKKTKARPKKPGLKLTLADGLARPSAGLTPAVGSPGVALPMDEKLPMRPGTPSHGLGLDRSGRGCVAWLRCSKELKSFSGYTVDVGVWRVKGDAPGVKTELAAPVPLHGDVDSALATPIPSSPVRS